MGQLVSIFFMTILAVSFVRSLFPLIFSFSFFQFSVVHIHSLAAPFHLNPNILYAPFLNNVIQVLGSGFLSRTLSEASRILWLLFNTLLLHSLLL